MRTGQAYSVCLRLMRLFQPSIRDEGKNSLVRPPLSDFGMERTKRENTRKKDEKKKMRGRVMEGGMDGEGKTKRSRKKKRRKLEKIAAHCSVCLYVCADVQRALSRYVYYILLVRTTVALLRICMYKRTNVHRTMYVHADCIVLVPYSYVVLRKLREP